MHQQEICHQNSKRKFYHPDDNVPDGLFSTNNVLIEKIYSGTEHPPIQVSVYLPGYLRAKAKNITDVDLTNLTSSFNMDLIFDLYLGDFFNSDERFKKKSQIQNENGKRMTYEEVLREKFKNEFKLNFSRGDPVLLSAFTNEEENLEIKVKAQKQNQISFTVRRLFTLHMDGNIWLSPFELLNSILQVTIQQMTFQLMETTYNFRVNFMTHPDNEKKFSLSEGQIEFGKYEAARNLVRSADTNQKVEDPTEFDMTIVQRHFYLQKKKAKKAGKTVEEYLKSAPDEKKINYFQYAYFNLPIYKHPFETIVTGFLPIWLLGVINLGIFFQDQNLNDRLGSIIGLVVALITYIPTIEATSPPTPKLVMAKLMVYLEICAVLCTFIHSMRIKFFQKFKLEWVNTPEYWISFWILVISASFVVMLTIIHYAYWKRVYKDTKYKHEKYENKQDRKKQKYNQKRMEICEELEPIQQSSTHSSQMFSIQLNEGKSMKFKKEDWSNLECDVYFNRFFTCERIYTPKEKQKKSNHLSVQQQFADYFVIKRREKALTFQNILGLKGPQISEPQTKSSNEKKRGITDKKQSNQQKSIVDNSKHKTCHPIVCFGFKGGSNINQTNTKDVQQVDLYLPTYLRMKFKNFNSLDFENLGGELNATIIMTIYYGDVFKYLTKQRLLDPQTKDKIMRMMKNDFLISFDKDESLLLSQGKIENKKKKPQKEGKEKDGQNYTPVRNINVTIKEDQKQKCINFTIRRCFQTQMVGNVFLTPIEKLKTSINITINALKIPIEESKRTFRMNLNFMNTKNVSEKISISEVKKFCRYGLVLSEMNIGYYNDKVLGDKEFKNFASIGDSQQGKRLATRMQEKNFEKLCEDLEKAFRLEEYTVLRQQYRKMCEKDLRLGKYCHERNISLLVTEKEEAYLKKNPTMALRRFSDNKSFSPYKHAFIMIPLYKYPMDSIAIIFFPLWLLAILNLGIYFQTEGFGERVVSIAALLIAFISLVPTIRQRIPPSPNITLVEYLVAALLFTCFLTLGHSMSVRFEIGFKFIDWNNSAWFLISLIITLLSGVIVLVLLVYHYAYLQPKYKLQRDTNDKFERKAWSNGKCEKEMSQRYLFEIVHQDSIDPKAVVYKIVKNKDYQKQSEKPHNSQTEQTEKLLHSPPQNQSWLAKFCGYLYRNSQNRIDSNANREVNSQETLKELKDEGQRL